MPEGWNPGLEGIRQKSMDLLRELDWKSVEFGWTRLAIGIDFWALELIVNLKESHSASDEDGHYERYKCQHLRSELSQLNCQNNS